MAQSGWKKNTAKIQAKSMTRTRNSPNWKKNNTCEGSSAQPAMNVVNAATLTDAQAHKLPQTNIHFILGTEHKSDEYNIATDSEIYDSANPNAVPNSAGEQVVDSRPGYMCPVSGYSAAQLVDNYVWQCCTGEMHIGKVRGIGTASNMRQT